MVLHILRALFILLMMAVGYANLKDVSPLSLVFALAIAVLFVTVDILSARRKVAVFTGIFAGLLVGIALAYALSLAVPLIIDSILAYTSQTVDTTRIKQFVNLLIGVVCCYLAISFILQTRDDFRFVIPYIEFSRQTKGARRILLDTSILIDGRILDIVGTKVLESQLIVAQCVINELQTLADTSDAQKRTRGRRGLEILTKLRKSSAADVVLYESAAASTDEGPVDQKLVELAKDLDARILTTDYNLSKVAQLREVDVINLNDLANALRPPLVAGERLTVRLVKAGEEPGQGVGYLPDGTMVVVEQARAKVNDEVAVTVTRSLQTTAGRMVFGRLSDDPPPAKTLPRDSAA